MTGASRGLGRALAEGFAAEGARLVVTATQEAHLASVLAALGGAADGVVLDLRDRDSATRAARLAVAALGRVDVLVNSAAVAGEQADLADTPPAMLADVLDVGVTGTLAFTQGILPAMADGGVIVNVTSGAAGRAGWGAYAVAKAALDAMTRMLREELAPRGITCVAVNPGGVRTAMRAAAMPQEDPATVPHPSSVLPAFVAIAAGEPTDWRVEAYQWT